MCADLVAGHFPESDPMLALTGQLMNATQGNIRAFSNTDWFGMTYTDSAAGGVSAVANAVAVPVDVGAIISNVTVLSGAAAGTITNANFQLFSGIATPAALGTQSTNVTSTPFTVNTALTTALGSPVLITSAVAPKGFIYVSLGLTNSVPPSFASAATAVAINTAPSQFGSTAPTLAAKYTGGGATQPATLVSPTAVAAAFLVWLS